MTHDLDLSKYDFGKSGRSSDIIWLVLENVWSDFLNFMSGGELFMKMNHNSEA